MYRLYFLFYLVCVSRAQIPSFGFCPDYLPMAHFDLNRFLGKWYEAERYFQFSEVASRCVVTDYAVGPNGKIYVSNEVTNRFTGVKRVIGGSMDLTGKRSEGKLVVKYDTTPISTTSTLTVLETDYDTYAVIWSCSGLGPINAQSAWLMTRERIPDSTTLQKAYGALDRQKINRTFFVKTDQEGCAIAASDFNAALGIASTSTNVEQTADQDNNREKMKVKAQPIHEILLQRGDEKAPVNTSGEEDSSETSTTGSLKSSAEPAPEDMESEGVPTVPEQSATNDSTLTEPMSENVSVKKVPEEIRATIVETGKAVEKEHNTSNNLVEKI